MSTPAAAPRSRFLRPAFILPVLGAIVVAVALLTPEPVEQGRGGVSTYSRSENGAQIAYELARRIGWRVTRRTAPLDSVTAPTIAHVVLAPREPLGAAEVHHLLESVRRGGALIASIDEGSALADSLHVAPTQLGRFVAPDSGEDCRARGDRASGIFAAPPFIAAISWRRPPPPDLLTFGSIAVRGGGEFPAAIGFALGQGRVALVSDAELFTNDIVRVCHLGADVLIARLFEFARNTDVPRGRATLAFDEYHHGYGLHPGSLRAVGRYLARTASGHVLLQIIAAGLILLFAAAPRPLVPQDPARTARRSPLEHADALGHAYAEVGATRTVVARLADGVRRRAGRHVASTGENESFLRALAETRPALRDDAARVERALRESVAPRELESVGESLRRIEHVLTTTGGR